MAASFSSQIEETLGNLLTSHPEGLTQEVLENGFVGIAPMEEVTVIINKLLSSRRISLSKLNGQLVYKELSQDHQAKFRDIGPEEIVVYQVIQSAGNKGIWTRDIKVASNLQQNRVVKILKTLEARKLVKEVKVATAKKKVYMLYEVEPSREITGGAWYDSVHGYDTEFIRGLREAAEKYVATKGYATCEDLYTFISKAGVLDVELRLEDMQSIVNTLVLDGKLDEFRDTRPGATLRRAPFFYKPSKLAALRNGFTEMPCGRCPVFADCSEHGDISPAKCVYYTRWLDF